MQEKDQEGVETEVASEDKKPVAWGVNAVVRPDGRWAVVILGAVLLVGGAGLWMLWNMAASLRAIENVLRTGNHAGTQHGRDGRDGQVGR